MKHRKLSPLSDTRSSDHAYDPQVYIADALTKIVNGHLANKLDELMPWAYAQSATAFKEVA